MTKVTKTHYITNLNNLHIMEFHKFCYVWKYAVGYDWKAVLVIKEEEDRFTKRLSTETEELFSFS